MAHTPINDPTPRSRVGSGARVLGYLVVAFLVIAIILLATKVVTFEQLGWF